MASSMAISSLSRSLSPEVVVVGSLRAAASMLWSRFALPDRAQGPCSTRKTPILTDQSTKADAPSRNMSESFDGVDQYSIQLLKRSAALSSIHAAAERVRATITD